MSNVVVVGGQLGDEGKGKVVDLLNGKFDISIRYGGGHNAGHTIWLDDKKIVLHVIPSGIVRPEQICVIGNGVVVSPNAVWSEMFELMAAGIGIGERLLISDRAHLILSYHQRQEAIEEEERGANRIGTTMRGIGPAYEDKYGRKGLRVCDLADMEKFRERLQNAISMKKRSFRGLEADADSIIDENERPLNYVRSKAVDCVEYLKQMSKQGKRVLFEGAQGSLLDVDHGTYPFVTSSSAAAGGACTGGGVGPTCIEAVYTVFKAYCTRVGAGPFPTVQKNAAGQLMHDRGEEKGASTGRDRDCGWYDAKAARCVNALNGTTKMILTKLDVLDAFSEIPVCCGYKYRGENVSGFPADAEMLEQCEPVYVVRKGWNRSTAGLREYNDLPQAAKDYVSFLEEVSEAEIGMVTSGPRREDFMITAHADDLLDSLDEESQPVAGTAGE